MIKFYFFAFILFVAQSFRTEASSGSAGSIYLPASSLPVITAIEPESGPVGTPVRISGKNFSAVKSENVVYFGSVAAIVSAASATELWVTVPEGADDKPLTISVTSAKASISFHRPFKVSYPGAPAGFRKDSFVEKINLFTGVTKPTISSATADFNNDGKTDLARIVLNSSTGIYICLNSGSLTEPYGPAYSFATSDVPLQIKACDFDGDGKIDLAASTSRGISILINRSTASNISFLAFNNAILRSNISTFECSDIDQDGKPDIVMGDNNTVSVARNLGYGFYYNFDTPVSLPSVSIPSAIYTSDFNCDGKPDLLLTFSESNTLTLYPNISDSGMVKFNNRKDFIAANKNPKLSIADINGDKFADLAILNTTSSEVSFMENTSSSDIISFDLLTETKTISSSAYDLLLSDFDGDTRPDLCVINPVSSALSVMKNQSTTGQIAFGDKTDYAVGNGSNAIVSLDYNNDGKADLLTYNTITPSTSVLRNRINEPLLFSGHLIRENNYSVELKGANLTGISTLTFANQTFTEYTAVSDTVLKIQLPENLTGELVLSSPYGSAKLAWLSTVRVPVINSVAPLTAPVGAIVTIKGNNFDPVAARNGVYFGSIQAVVKSADYTTLEVYVPVSAMFAPVSVTTNGLTAQSKQLFTVSFQGLPNPLTERSFDDKKEYSISKDDTYYTPAAALSCDFNADGKIDIAVLSANRSEIHIFKNNKNTFGEPDLILRGYFRSAIKSCDLDNDGKPDIVVGTLEGILLLRNTSSGSVISFATAQKLSFGSLDDLVISDLDNNGKLDILTFRSGVASFTIFSNKSTAGNISFTTNPAVASSSVIYALNAADINGDELNDVILATSSGIYGFLNKGAFPALSFTNTLLYQDNNAGSRLLVADFDSDTKPDLLYSQRFSPTVLNILKNKNTAALTNFSTLTKINFPYSSVNVLLNDFDGDGKADILALGSASSSYHQLIFKNTSTADAIFFTQAAKFIGSQNTLNASSADWTGDNKPDWAILMASPNNFSVFRNRLSEPLLYSYHINTDSSVPLITLKGYNLTGTHSITIDDVLVTGFDVVADSIVTFRVSTGVYGTLSLKNLYGQADMEGFSSTAAPEITSFSPLEGGIGSTVVITGKNFNPVTDANKVYFGHALGKVQSASETSLTVTVPPGAVYGNLKVLTNGMYGLSPKNFTLTFAGRGKKLNNGSFALKSTSKIAPGASSSIIADLTGDGKPEVIIQYGARNFRIYKISGDSVFTELNHSIQIDYDVSKYAAGDIDGDGLADLVINNYSLNKISVYRNTTAAGAEINFAEPVDLDDVKWPQNISIKDLNADGKADLMVRSSSYSQYLFKNIGKPGTILFAKKKEINTGPSLSNVVTGDLNGDGKPEILAYYYETATFNVLRNKSLDSDLDFYEPVSFEIQKGISHVEISDINNDGRNDLILSDTSKDSINVLLGKGNGIIQFDLPKKFYSGARSGEIIVTDLNGDAKPDILISNKGISTLSFLGGKDPVLKDFDARCNVPASFNMESVSIADFTLDGRPDILSFDNGNTASLSLYRNEIPEPKLLSFERVKNSSNIYEISGFYLSEASAVTFGGKPAVSFVINSDNNITIEAPQNAASPIEVITPYGRGRLNIVINKLKPVITTFSPLSAAAGSTIEVKGANFSEVASENIVSFGIVKASVIAATETTLLVEVPVSASYAPISVTTNHLTTQSSRSFITTFDNNNPSFPANALGAVSQVAETGNTTSGVIAADFNNDGRPDIAASNNYDKNIVIYNNKGSGNIPFNTKPDYVLNSAYYPRFLSQADFNGDGKADLIWINSDARLLTAYMNKSFNDQLSFEGRCDMPVDGLMSDMVLGDMDNDGKTDVIIASADKAKLYLFRNISLTDKIQFAAGIEVAVQSLALALTVDDFNGDGFPDVAATPQSGTEAIVFINNGIPGSGWLQSKFTLTTGNAFSHSIESGDVDGDGKPDILISSSSLLSVYRNLSEGSSISFAAKKDFPANSSNNPMSIKMGDINGDGKADIVTETFNYSSYGRACIYKNLSTIGNIELSKRFEYPTNSTLDFVVNDLTGDSRPDLLSAAGWSVYLMKNTTTTFPIISSISPDKECLPGTTVTITGFNLGDTKSVSFGGYKAASFDVVSPNVVTAVTAIPTGKGGDMAVYLDTEAGNTYYDPFTYIPRPFIEQAPATIIDGNYYTLYATYFGDNAKYQWYKDGQPIAGATDSYYQARSTGYYHVQVDSAVCNTSDPVIVNVITSLTGVFRLSSNAISCKGAANGKISITAVITGDFKATITKTGFSRIIPFTKSLVIDMLESGTYSVCIAETGKEVTKLCYTIDIKEPADLSLYSAVNASMSSVDLFLGGADLYKINLNGREIAVKDTKVTLPLQEGQNKLSVSSENACQGSIDKTILLTTDIKVFPNPFEKQIEVFIPQAVGETAVLDLFTLTGKKLSSKTLSISNSNITTEFPDLIPGMYLLQITYENQILVQKIVKK